MRTAGRYSLFAALFSIFTSGCVSVQEMPIEANSLDTLKGRELMLSVRARPDFAAMTVGKAAIGGLIGAAAMISAGNEIVAHNDIQDPARHISERLGRALKDSYGVRLASRETAIVSDEISEIVSNSPDADLVLDTRTINWSLAYFPTSWGKYRVIYSARLRLVDVKRRKVLAEGGCRHLPEETEMSPSYDELIANNAARLKLELAAAAAFCAGEFGSKTLAMALEPATTARAAKSAIAARPMKPVAAGDVWTYRLTSPGRAAMPIEVVMTAAGTEEISEQFLADDGSPRRLVHRRGAYLEPFGALSLFSPYFAAFERLQPGAPIRDIDNRDPRTCGPAWSCSVRGRVAARERLRLPAGEFDAIRVDIEQSWITAPNTPSGHEVGGRTLSVWYSSDMKRAVKFSSRGGASAQIDTVFDLELASYRPGAAAAVKPDR